MRQHKTVSAVFSHAAQVYSELRGNASLFAIFHHDSMDLEVGSAARELEVKPGQTTLPSDTPNPLLGYVLSSRCSIHVPDIRGLDKRSLAQRISDTGGQEVYNMDPVAFEMLEDGFVHDVALPARQVNALLPLGFSGERGSLLVTPLGLEASTRFAFGFMLEHLPERAFSLEEIVESQTYSALFTVEIVSRLLRQLR